MKGIITVWIMCALIVGFIFGVLCFYESCPPCPEPETAGVDTVIRKGENIMKLNVSDEARERLAIKRKDDSLADATFMERIEKDHQKHQRVVDDFNQNVRPNLKPAQLGEYVAWLEGHISNGGNITHNYDYLFNNRNWYVAITDCELPPLYGASSVYIIVPKGIVISTPNGLAHNGLYFMDEFRNEGGWVPIYENIEL